MLKPQTVVFSLIAFAAPILIAFTVNWEQIRPYMVGDPDLAQGKMLYFAAKG